MAEREHMAIVGRRDPVMGYVSVVVPVSTFERGPAYMSALIDVEIERRKKRDAELAAAQREKEVERALARSGRV